VEFVVELLVLETGKEIGVLLLFLNEFLLEL
jgi:hypothetical protein